MIQKKSQKIRQELVSEVKNIRPNQPFEKNTSLTVMQRKIHKLERSLAQRENEVWTLKQLLLYR
ncbi:MAG: hypothetical protein HY800_00205 [Ignavibacteriales bacterium]|nr:hypothetical protein [Ignavibacteriales bacterium]